MDASGGHRGTRNHHQHHGGRHDGHRNHAHVVDEGEERTDLGGALRNEVPTEPDDADIRQVDDDHHRGEHQGEQAADLHGHVVEVRVGVLVARTNERLADEGADDANTREFFAQHRVHDVDAILLEAELRDKARHDEAGDPGQSGDENQENDGQMRVLTHCLDDTADSHDGRLHHEGENHEGDVLNLEHIVSRSSHQ